MRPGDQGCLLFPLLWDTGTPPWRHCHLPSPHPLSLCSSPIQRLLFISLQSSQSSQPTREAHKYRGCTAPILLVYGKPDRANHNPFPLLSSPEAPCTHQPSSTLPSHQAKWQEGRLLSEINKPLSNTYLKLGQLGFYNNLCTILGPLP